MSNWRQPALPGTKFVSTSNRGKNFEAELDAVNEYYRLKGIVDVVKNAEKWEFSDKLKSGSSADQHLKRVAGGSPTVAVTGDDWIIKRAVSDVDYSGGNQFGSYIFDAKEAAGDFIPLDKLKSTQIARLYQSSRCGVVAGFLIKFTAQNRVLFAPVAFVRQKEQIKLKQTGKRAAAGTARITIGELEEHGFEIGKIKINGLWDWYKTLSILNQELKQK